METPVSTRRVTRSQTLAAETSNGKITMSRNNEESDKDLSRSRQRNGKNQQQQDRSALIDITNDSPIVGLAVGGSLVETPVSSIVKQRSNFGKRTPGSGEALLRGQVKTLLQKVEEEATEVPKFSSEQKAGPFLHLKGLVNSPIGLLAPTPTNTPADLNNINYVGSASITSSAPLIEEHMNISQVVEDLVDMKMQEGSIESQRSVITRSLLLDFFDSPDCSSAVSYQEMGGAESEGRGGGKSSADDDNASVWSIQVNVSTRDDEEEEEVEGIEQEQDEDYCCEGEGEDNGEFIDELCEGLNKMDVNEMRKGPKFEGKHTRFVYNSDDEIEGEEGEEEETSPNILHLKGLPTPKGKYFRFPEEEEEQ